MILYYSITVVRTWYFQKSLVQYSTVQYPYKAIFDDDYPLLHLWYIQYTTVLYKHDIFYVQRRVHPVCTPFADVYNTVSSKTLIRDFALYIRVTDCTLFTYVHNHSRPGAFVNIRRRFFFSVTSVTVWSLKKLRR